MKFLEDWVWGRCDGREGFLFFFFLFVGGLIEPLGFFLQVEGDLQLPGWIAFFKFVGLMKHLNNQIIKAKPACSSSTNCYLVNTYQISSPCPLAHQF
jgi:hypothetical protein